MKSNAKSKVYLSVLVAGLMAVAGAHAQSTSAGSASATTGSPDRAGEASTRVGGNPNVDPQQPTVQKDRAELRTERDLNRAEKAATRSTATMGNTGYGTPSGTPATAPEGTPSVFDGGTPK